MILRCIIIRFLLFFFFIFSYTCCLKAQQSGNKLNISELKSNIDLYFYENFDSVLSISKRLIELAQYNNQVEIELETIHNLCWSADYHKRMREFRSFLITGNELMTRRSADLDSVDPAHIHKASMLHATGVYYFDLGDYGLAIEKFLRIVNPLTGPFITDSSLLRSSCYYLGQSYFYLGSLDKSIQFFDQGRNYIDRNNEDYYYLNALYHMYNSEYLISVGRTDDAFAGLKRAIQILLNDPRKSFTRNSLKSYYMMMASLYHRTGQTDTALIYRNKSLSYYKPDDPDFVKGYYFIGELFYQLKKPDSALYYYTRSIEFADRIYENKHYNKSGPLAGIANLCRDNEEFEKARQLYRQSFECLMGGTTIDYTGKISLESLSSVLMPRQAINVMLEHAKMFYQWFQIASTKSFLDSCLAILENALFLNDLSRRELISAETKESKALLRSQITGLGVEAAAKAFEITTDNSYMIKAFAFIEESKGNILLDNINEVRARKFSGIPEIMLEKLSLVKSELAIKKDSLLKTAITDSNNAGRKTRYNDKLREYIALLSELEENYPRYYQLKYDPGNVSLEEIQRYLSNRSLLLQYYTGDEKIYVAGITKDQIIIKIIERSDELDRYIGTLLNQLRDRRIMESENDQILFEEFTFASRYLYNKILYPVLSEIKSIVKDLIIIPDGNLCYLPFEILLAKEIKNRVQDYSDLPYLIRYYTIRYDYSSSLLVENKLNKNKTDKMYVGFAPAYENDDRYSVTSLFANQDEIKACGEIWNGRSLLGDDATENSFREFSSHAGILHLATHTILNDRDPGISSFAFTADSLQNEDGHLYTYELYDMNILSRLVILSGCETGTGQFKDGEGIISLARAFKYAGSPNIIMSLWKVNDRTTKEIMITFNKYLKKGFHKDKALQLAKITYLNHSRNIHPAYWSSFVLIGNQLPVRHGSLIYYLIPIILIFLYVFIKLKKYKFR